MPLVRKLIDMDIRELILDETAEGSGVFAISLVDEPAIEADFIALNKQYENKPIKFEAVEGEKRVLRGPALIPNKTIFRKGEGEDDNYYVFFSKETIAKTQELYMKNKAQGEQTLQHKEKVEGVTVIESWIVEDAQKDKSALHDFKVPEGTWMVTMKVDNDDIWENFVKTGEVKGFSIEGYFADKVEASKQEPSLIDILKERLSGVV